MLSRWRRRRRRRSLEERMPTDGQDCRQECAIGHGGREDSAGCAGAEACCRGKKPEDQQGCEKLEIELVCIGALNQAFPVAQNIRERMERKPITVRTTIGAAILCQPFGFSDSAQPMARTRIRKPIQKRERQGLPREDLATAVHRAARYTLVDWVRTTTRLPLRSSRSCERRQDG